VKRQQEDDGTDEAIGRDDFGRMNVLLGRRNEPASIAGSYSPLGDNDSLA
jgi:hypothetical protein